MRDWNLFVGDGGARGGADWRRGVLFLKWAVRGYTGWARRGGRGGWLSFLEMKMKKRDGWGGGVLGLRGCGCGVEDCFEDAR